MASFPFLTIAVVLQCLTILYSTIPFAYGRTIHDTSLTIATNQIYDYIIVGGGLTGLVTANRFSENGNKTVLIIENGYIDDGPLTSIPHMASILNTADLYPITSAPVPGLNNSVWAVSVGNVVGGGSVVNGMQRDCGADADYDAWEQLGNGGWGAKGLAKYLKKSTHFTPPSESSREAFGLTYDENAYGDGPVQVTISSYQFPDMKTIFDAWKAEGVPMPKEGFANAIGAYWSPNSVDNKTATRSHARKVYYDSIASRPNLKLMTGTKATEIILEETSNKLTAKGVKIASRADSSTAEVFANNVLDAANITVKREAPGVGSNFQDHIPLYMTFNLSHTANPDPTTFSTNATFNGSAYEQYLADRQGPYTFGRGNALGMLSFSQLSSKAKLITSKFGRQSNLTQYLPERYARSEQLLSGFKKQRQILLDLYSRNDSAIGEFPIQPWGRSAVAHQKPLSRGTITLNNTDPHNFPVVQYNTLQNPIDAEVIAELVRFNRRHWARKELSVYSPVENVPGAHCSAAMMPEELGSIVDTKLRVYGVDRLRIVDASIIPLIPSTHLQATMYAVAEKAADLIKDV
ncbi:GMC oxidoreductase [Lophiostoma macrostomum CBS 122681]|uniref:GMC oxidoreductase n=1 Tax=Lophiostoma macrostomum CBS 122681 TaxID=1314788 RepID=A0A6A6T9K4_9PLEO|nr:GMC oxidoreductase [Lophiostoma macrostomum CBS 122681]